MILLSIAASMLQIVGTCGFFTSHAEVAGPFAGFFFAVTNTVANMSGFIGPLVVSAVAPNVRNKLTITYGNIKVASNYNRALKKSGLMCFTLEEQ